jgi:hypothetical protein
MEPLAPALFVLPHARCERFGVVEPLAPALSVFPHARCGRFGVVEPLAPALFVLPHARCGRFDVVEPLAPALFVFPQARCERFGVVEPLAPALSVFPQARCERFGVVEPLAATRSSSAARVSSLVAGVGGTLECHPFRDRVRRHRAAEPLRLPAPAEENHRRNAADSEARRHLRQRLRIDLRHDDRPAALGRQLRELGRDHATRAAPGGPEVDQDGRWGVSNELVELLCAADDYGVRERQERSLARGALRLVSQASGGQAVGPRARGAVDDHERCAQRANGRPAAQDVCWRPKADARSTGAVWRGVHARVVEAISRRGRRDGLRDPRARRRVRHGGADPAIGPATMRCLEGAVRNMRPERFVGDAVSVTVPIEILRQGD